MLAARRPTRTSACPARGRREPGVRAGEAILRRAVQYCTSARERARRAQRGRAADVLQETWTPRPRASPMPQRHRSLHPSTTTRHPPSRQPRLSLEESFPRQQSPLAQRKAGPCRPHLVLETVNVDLRRVRQRQAREIRASEALQAGATSPGARACRAPRGHRRDARRAGPPDGGQRGANAERQAGAFAWGKGGEERRQQGTAGAKG